MQLRAHGQGCGGGEGEAGTDRQTSQRQIECCHARGMLLMLPKGPPAGSPGDVRTQPSKQQPGLPEEAGCRPRKNGANRYRVESERE